MAVFSRKLQALAGGAVRADMVLIDGDPTRNIGDVRHVRRTVRGGRVYDPAAFGQTMGMSR